MFYLLTPAEVGQYKHDYFNDHRDDPGPDFINKSGPLLFTFALAELLYNLLVLKRKVNLADLMTNLSQGLAFFIYRKLGLEQPLKVLYYSAYDHRLFDLESNGFLETWTGYLFVFLLVDFVYYLLHRWSHEINVLWSFHSVHHSSQHYNIGTGIRQPVLAIAFIFWVHALVSLVGVPPIQFKIHLELNLLYQFWIHTEMIDRLHPAFEYIFNTPSHHRIHHGRNRACIDKNYAGTLIIWDRMFGTFEQEPAYLQCGKVKEQKPIAYGLVHNLDSFSTFKIQTSHFGYMYQKAVSGLDVSWFQHLCYGPGYSGAKNEPRTGILEDIPEPEEPTQFMESPLEQGTDCSRWLLLYVALRFVSAFQVCEEMKLVELTMAVTILFSITVLYHVEHYTEFLDGRALHAETGKSLVGRELLVNLGTSAVYFYIFGEVKLLLLPMLCCLIVVMDQR